jgi:hypothetical protein
MKNMENRMVSSFLRSILPAAAVVSLLGFVGCAGSKNSSSGSDYSAMDSGSSEPAKSAKVDDARRSAEEAEAKAHQLREEKARNQAKPASN